MTMTALQRKKYGARAMMKLVFEMTTWPPLEVTFIFLTCRRRARPTGWVSSWPNTVDHMGLGSRKKMTTQQAAPAAAGPRRCPRRNRPAARATTRAPPRCKREQQDRDDELHPLRHRADLPQRHREHRGKLNLRVLCVPVANLSLKFSVQTKMRAMTQDPVLQIFSG